MYKTALATIFISSSLVATPMFASNFFKTLANPTTKIGTSIQANKQFKAKGGVNNYVDFSGTWVGRCDFEEEIDTITIKSSEFEFQVDDLTFVIGILDTKSYANENISAFFHTLFEWNADHSMLSFDFSIAGFTHMQDYHDKNFGNGKGTISLNNDQLVFEGSMKNSDIENETFICTYKKQ